MPQRDVVSHGTAYHALHNLLLPLPPPQRRAPEPDRLSLRCQASRLPTYMPEGARQATPASHSLPVAVGPPYDPPRVRLRQPD